MGIGEAGEQDAVIEAVTVWQSPSGFGDTMGTHPDESKIEQTLRSVTFSGICGPCPVLKEEREDDERRSPC